MPRLGRFVLPEQGGDLVAFERVREARTADQIVDTLLARIEAGSLKIGDRLPGENALAAEFGVSRASLREALRIMEAVGAVKVRPGKGWYVLRGAKEADGASFWLSWLLKGRQEFLVFLELREAVEAKMASLAAERATDDELAALGKLLEEMWAALRAGNLGPEQALQMDLQFHRTLSASSRSPYLAEVALAAVEAVQAYRRGAISMPNRIQTSWEGHAQVYEALRKRDPAAAAEAMSAHIKRIAQDLNRRAGQH